MESPDRRVDPLLECMQRQEGTNKYFGCDYNRLGMLNDLTRSDIHCSAKISYMRLSKPLAFDLNQRAIIRLKLRALIRRPGRCNEREF